MKTIYLIAAIIFLFPFLANSEEFLEKVESEVYETSGTPQKIAEKAKTCIAQIVKNDEVRISDNTSGTGAFSFTGGGKGSHSGGVAGGGLFIDVNIEEGKVIANNRVDYTSMMMKNNVKSVMTFMAKDGRFKIRHENIEYLMKNTGSAHNDGYMRVRKGWGTGWGKAEEALNGLSGKVAVCVQQEPAKEKDW